MLCPCCTSISMIKIYQDIKYNSTTIKLQNYIFCHNAKINDNNMPVQIILRLNNLKQTLFCFQPRQNNVIVATALLLIQRKCGRTMLKEDYSYTFCNGAG